MALASLTPDIQAFSNRFGLQGELRLLEVEWDREMGAWKHQVRLEAIDQESLVIDVQSSVALQELSLRKKEIVRRLNAHFPAPWIKTLTLRMARYGNGR